MNQTNQINQIDQTDEICQMWRPDPLTLPIMPPDIPPNTKGTKYPLITIGAPIAFFWNVEKRHNNNNAPQKNEPNTKIMRLFLFDILSLHLVLI